MTWRTPGLNDKTRTMLLSGRGVGLGESVWLDSAGCVAVGHLFPLTTPEIVQNVHTFVKRILTENQQVLLSVFKVL